MSCPQSSRHLMKDTISDNSSDYGSDFTPDEEEVLNKLLAQAVKEHATPLHATPPPPPTQPSTTTPTAKETNGAVGDIEDCHVAPSSPRTPKVLGRQKTVWQVSRTWRSPVAGRAGQMASNGDAAFGINPVFFFPDFGVLMFVGMC